MTTPSGIGVPTASGLMFGGTAPAPVNIPTPGTMGVPSYPGPTIMTTATTPAPPHLPESLSELERAVWLARYYRGAFDSRYKPKHPCGVLVRKRELEKSRYKELLIESAEAMLEYNIRPAAWVAWRFDGWRASEQSTKGPPLAWVFGPKRIDEHVGWFRHEAGSYTGGRLIYGPAAKDMMERYALMQRALTWARPKNEAEVRVVVDKHFPNGLYDRLLEQARVEATQDQALMGESAARGEWVGW